MKKNLLALILAGAMVLSLAACSSSLAIPPPLPLLAMLLLVMKLSPWWVVLPKQKILL